MELENLQTNQYLYLLQLEAENEVNNEMANRMSLFYAEATPMLKTLSNATTKFVSEVSRNVISYSTAPEEWHVCPLWLTVN